VNTYDSICRDLALRTGFAVVFPEYTLAPEARYPTQQEQCYATLKWISENGDSQGLSRSKFSIVGDSAGGKSHEFRLRMETLMLPYRATNGSRYYSLINPHSHHPHLIPGPYLSGHRHSNQRSQYAQRIPVLQWPVQHRSICAPSHRYVYSIPARP
jgi:hypothetical protein